MFNDIMEFGLFGTDGYRFCGVTDIVQTLVYSILCIYVIFTEVLFFCRAVPHRRMNSLRNRYQSLGFLR